MDCSPPGFSVHVKPVVQVSPGLSNGCGIICYILDAFSFKKQLIYFWLHWVFAAVPGLFLAVASRG